jgi:hypothetical protein
MAEIPYSLLARLGQQSAAALSSAVDAIGEELAVVYNQNVQDHSEARGDNAQLFGQKIWHHGDFRITGRLEGEPDIAVVHSNGSYRIEISPISLGVYKLGDTMDEDIHDCFPDDSPTKRSYAERNGAQLRLFELPSDTKLPPEARYGLNDLIVGHFGNPRDGLVKWYVGAPTTEDEGTRRWAWIHAQPLQLAKSQPVVRSTRVAPFDPHRAEPLEVRPRPKRQVSQRPRTADG